MRKHTRVEFLLFNVAIACVGAGLAMLSDSALVFLPGLFAYGWNVRARLAHIGWDTGIGWVIMWTLGACVPIVGLIIGLVLLLTPAGTPE
jgi:hypothetical protein